MKNHAGSDAVVEVVRIGEWEKVTGADVEVFSETVGDADQAFEIHITIVRSVERGVTSDFEMKVKHSSGAAVVIAILVVCVAFTKRFHQSETVDEFGFIGIETMFDGDDGVQSETFSEIVPHRDAGCDGGVATEIAAACWEHGFNLGGEEKTIGIDKKRTWDDGEIAKTFRGTDAFFVFEDVRNFDDHAESLGEGPFKFDFGLVFGEALAVQIGVVDEKIAAGESRLDDERVNVRSSAFAGVKVREGREEISGESCR